MGLIDAYDNVTTWLGTEMFMMAGGEDPYKNGTFIAPPSNKTTAEILGSNAGYAGGFVEGNSFDPQLAGNVTDAVNQVGNLASNLLSAVNPQTYVDDAIDKGKKLLLMGGIIVFGIYALKKGWLK